MTWIFTKCVRTFLSSETLTDPDECVVIANNQIYSHLKRKIFGDF